MKLIYIVEEMYSLIYVLHFCILRAMLIKANQESFIAVILWYIMMKNFPHGRQMFAYFTCWCRWCYNQQEEQDGQIPYHDAWKQYQTIKMKRQAPTRQQMISYADV